MIAGFVITQEELTDLVAKASDNNLSKNYTIDDIIDMIDKYWISKSEVEAVYFWDILNVLETKEEVDNYIQQILKEWDM